MLAIHYATIVLLCLTGLMALVIVMMVIHANRDRSERIGSGDRDAVLCFSTVANLPLGRHRLAISTGQPFYGIVPIVDPARIIEGKPVVVGHRVNTPYVSLSWSLRWPYPWTIRNRDPRRPAETKLSVLVVALYNYAEEHGGSLPHMTDPAALRRTLARYALLDGRRRWNAQTVLHGPNGEPLAVNASLSGRSLAVCDPATIAFYAEEPDESGRRPVIGLDLKLMRWVDEQEWEELKRLSGIA